MALSVYGVVPVLILPAAADRLTVWLMVDVATGPPPAKLLPPPGGGVPGEA